MGNDIVLRLSFKAVCFDFRSTNVGSSVIKTCSTTGFDVITLLHQQLFTAKANGDYSALWAINIVSMVAKSRILRKYWSDILPEKQMVLPNMFNERPEILMLFHADVYTFHDKKLSYYKREKIMELMSLVAHPLICQCAKVWILNIT